VLLVTVYAVRHLKLPVYGIFAFCIANLQLFDSLIGSPLDMSALKLAPTYRREGFVGITPPERALVLVKMGMAVLILIVLAVFGEQIGQLVFHASGGRLILISLGFSALGLLAFRSLQCHSLLDLRFRLYGSADLSQTAIRVLLSVGLIATGIASPALLVSGYGLAPLAVVLIFSPFIFREPQTPAAWFEPKTCRSVLRESGVLMLIAAFSVLVSNQDMYFLALRRGMADVGILRASYTIAFIPELLGTYIGQAVIPRIVPLCQKGEFQDFYRRFQRWALVGGLVVLTAGLLLVDPVVTRLFPPSYREALKTIKILLPAGVASLIGYPLTLNFLIFYEPKVFLFVDAALAPCMAAGYYFAARQGVVAVAWVTCIARLVKFAVTQIYGLRLAGRVNLRSV
jgi:O-antigen/teichoic acid export membrane protein